MNNSLFVAWRSGDADGGCWGPVGRLERLGEYAPGSARYRFVYTRGAKTLPGFYPFPDMPDVEKIYESDELLPMFTNRLLSKSRPEYKAYLAWSGFDPMEPPDPLALLGVTEGRRATDLIEMFPCPRPDTDGCFINKFFLRGVRFLNDEGLACVAGLASGTELQIRPEPDNPKDTQAMLVLTLPTEGGKKIGYMPRYLAHDAHDLLVECGEDAVSVTVEKVNPGAPMQQRVLCRMTACSPDGFRPCNGEAFEPIVNGLPSVLS